MKRFRVCFSLVLGLLFLVFGLGAKALAQHEWQIEIAAVGKIFRNMGPRHMVLDQEGHPHMAYGGNHLFYAYYDGESWHIETVDSEGDVGWYTSLALDASGHPHISYYDETNGDLKYAYYDGESWHIETVDSEGDVGWYTSLALDASGHPHISYYEYINVYFKYVKYAYYDGESWHIETVDSAGYGGNYTSLALDASGHPHISYYSGTALKYAYYDGESWHIETVDSGGNVGKFSSLALDSSDHPHISYFDDRSNELKYAYYDGTSWHIETVDSKGDVGLYTSLALDASGHPHISYCDWWIHYLKYAYYDGESWHIETVDSKGDVGLYTSLALDASGHPHISSYDGINDDLKYAYYDGESWHIETVDSVGIVGEYTSLALDASGHPHISYYDFTNDDLKYAYYDGESWHIETVDSKGDVGLYTSLALDASGHPHISYYDDTNDDLKYAYHDGTSWHIETVDSEGIVGKYTSLALDASGYPHISYYEWGSDELKYAYYDGESWHIETVDTGWVDYTTSLALDASGYPHISYDRNGDLKYAYYDGESWHIETVDSEGKVEYTSLALDASGHPHISYYDYTNKDLKYAYYDGTSWHIETVDSEGKVGKYTSLALDASGYPHISYYDATHGDLKYAYVPSQTGATYTLTIDPVPEHGSVLVPEEGGQISCGLAGEDCSETYEEGTEVTLYAEPDEGYRFACWTGDCAGCEGTTCTITMDSDKTCSAEFEEVPNQPPVIDSFSADPTSGEAPLTVNFTCEAYDPDGTIVQYQWDFDGDNVFDQITEIGSVTHTYEAAGMYEARCKVVDNDGAEAVSDPEEITVQAPPTLYTLTIDPVPSHGSVLVPEEGGQISCGLVGEDCSETYEEGTEVTLYAQADEGYRFAGWGGDCAGCGSDTKCTITMDSDKTCSAEFEEVPNEPPVIEAFSADPSLGEAPLTVNFTCEAYDPDGTIVEYQWDFDGDNIFEETTETGSTSHTYEAAGMYEARCKVVDDDGAEAVSDPEEITVQAPPILYTLTIDPVPEHGSVLVPEEGGQISCGLVGEDCSETYEEGTEVTLYAEPDEGYRFAGWTGDCAGCEGATCTIVMDSDKTCSATFEEVAGPMPDLVVARILTPRYWMAGRFTIVTVLIENRGEADVTEPFDVYVYLNPFAGIIDIGRQTVNGLAAGQRKLVRFRIQVPEEACYPTIHHTLHAVVDSDNVVSESNEENNEATKDITLRFCPIAD